MTTTIARIEVRPLVVPLERPWGADVRDIRVLVVTVHDSDGATGTGFSWTPTVGATAVRAMLEDELVPRAIGRRAHPEIWRSLWEGVHEAGGGGVTTIALAGIDLALWDLVARRQESSVISLLGREQESQPAYGSGVNLHYSDDELAHQVERWVGAGFGAVKMKVGRPELAEDVRRVRLVRQILGPDRALMVDANQRWTLDAATTAARALEPFDIAWLEEPLRADDTAGYIALRARTDIPLAQGENRHTVHGFAELLDRGACDIVQPNIVRVGGITPFLDIVASARDRGAELCPHLLPELSAQLAFTLPERTWVEDVEDAGFARLGTLSTPTGVRIADGRARGGPERGLGFDFA